MNNFDFKLNDGETAVVLSEQNRYYFTGFRSSDGVLLAFSDGNVLLIDGRYFEAAERTVKNAKVVLLKRFSEQLKNITAEKKIKTVFCENTVTVSQFEFLRKNVNGASVSADEKFNSYIINKRKTKSDFEIDCIKKAQEIAEKSLNEVLKIIKVGITEKQIAAELEYRMKLNGSDGASFDTIAISGKNTSLPHGVPTDKKVQNGEFITMDFGATYKGYHSDMTRTVAVGKISDKMANVYDTVLSANLKGVAEIKSGVAAKTVDNAARSVIQKSGYGEFFVHSTGHGVGLDIHESPNVTIGNGELLKAGEIITVEPGIYLPDEFGVRIEDMLCVEENSAYNLTNYKKSLIII